MEAPPVAELPSPEPPSLAPTLLQLDFSRATELTFIVIVFSFLFIDVFDALLPSIESAVLAGVYS